jgi:hypothetical protein
MKIKSLPMLFLALTAFLPINVALGEEVLENENGAVAQEVENDGSTRDYGYDDEGRVILVREVDGMITRYWYDEDGVQHLVGEE